MTHDDLVVGLIAASSSGAVWVLGLALAWAFRGASLRWLPAWVAFVAVGSVVAAVVGTSRAMFLSSHDYTVVLQVCLVASLVSAGFATLVGLAVVRWSRRLREGARQFGESGRYDATVGGPAEFVALHEQLRSASARLAEARGRERQLEDSRRELVSWVSHDLRTPLAGLRAMAEALEDGMAEDPARYHHQMVLEVDRTVRLVDDLFELSRIQAGLLRPELETVALGDLVSESLAGAGSVARARGVIVRGEVDGDVMLEADPGAVSRVIANLLANAVRHTPSGGEVHVRGWSAGEDVVLTVDDGCGGIAAEEIDRVFDLAFRGEQARTPDAQTSRSGAGAGLGLAIVRGVVEAHDGRVDVENRGAGCRFTVHLPTAGARVRRAQSAR